MANKEKAINFIKQLDMHENVLAEFKAGTINASESGGILYWANEHETEMIVKLQADGNVVWHIIRGIFVLGGVDECEMTCYLLATEDDPSYLMVEDGEYEVFAFVANISWPDCSEYGYIYIKPSVGGLVRTA